MMGRTAIVVLLALVTGGCGMARFQLDDDIVIDTKLSVAWQRTSSQKLVSFDGASAYCRTVEDGHLTGWRLPSQLELPDEYDEAAFTDAGHWAWATTANGTWAAWYLDRYGLESCPSSCQFDLSYGAHSDPGMRVTGGMHISDGDRLTTRCARTFVYDRPFGAY